MSNQCCHISATMSDVVNIQCAVSDMLTISSEITIPDHFHFDSYDGATEVTPSQEQQILPTQGKVVLSNITINPIPSNYGLITYNGSILTVS